LKARSPETLKPSFIFFDVGNTLLFLNRDHVLKPLYDRGIFPTDEQWKSVERRSKNEFDDIIEHGGHADHSFWWMFYAHLLADLSVDAETVHTALVEATRISANWNVIRPGTTDTLERLAKRYRIAVISNADGKIADVLERTGISHLFPVITDSGIVGQEKPHPLIFQTALKDTGARAEESLYVGDVYSVDYLGATRAGMQAILFDVSGAYRDKGLPRVESLQELEKRLN
jgi:HAD superfamily hydrolase (TIGR01549 family)